VVVLHSIVLRIPVSRPGVVLMAYGSNRQQVMLEVPLVPLVPSPCVWDTR
jgi:hypothetical protein